MAKRDLKALTKSVDEVGGVGALKTGEWFPALIGRTFRSYYENSTPEYFQKKYPNLGRDEILKKLRKASIRQAGIIGAATGAVMSGNEILALITGGELGVGLAGSILMGLLTIGGELVAVTTIQLRLVLQTARLYGLNLDLTDPEDVWTVFGFALGGEIGEELSRIGIGIGRRVTKDAIKRCVRGDVLEAAKRVATRIGFKLLQKRLISFFVPVVSIGIGAAMNRAFTAKIASIAKRHFESIHHERNTELSNREQLPCTKVVEALDV